jgi:UDP-glucose 4-epimerase
MILVTGASGFVGTALVTELERRTVPFRPTSRVPRDGFFAIGDIGPGTDWTGALSGVDTVVHLAARVHQMTDSPQSAEAAHRAVNTEATLRLASEAARLGVRRLVFVSSIKVNGEGTPEGRPFRAEDAPRPDGPYARSKLAAEQGLQKLSDETGLEVVIVRPPLVYGRGVKANFGSLVKAVRAGIPLPLGAVRNRRSLVYVETLVDLLIRCAAHPAAAGKVVLVSDDQDLSTRELVQEIGVAMGKPARLIAVPPGLMRSALTLLGRGSVAERLFTNLQVDIGATRQLLDWAPSISVAEGLRRSLGG